MQPWAKSDSLCQNQGVRSPHASSDPFLSPAHSVLSVPSALQPTEGRLASQGPEHDRMASLLKGMMDYITELAVSVAPTTAPAAEQESVSSPQCLPVGVSLTTGIKEPLQTG
ncbi:unnamed protein product [Pleuronectes platessa]|uniref:Uncharacterized protein n=1 Tax=Pleuronectes platessa TaxID=8262 RepID=A0A9N7U064_PLEPL|nr:unnamed protein product [Pleuronectes platessa]